MKRARDPFFQLRLMPLVENGDLNCLMKRPPPCALRGDINGTEAMGDTAAAVAAGTFFLGDKEKDLPISFTPFDFFGVGGGRQVDRARSRTSTVISSSWCLIEASVASLPGLALTINDLFLRRKDETFKLWHVGTFAFMMSFTTSIRTTTNREKTAHGSS